MNINYEEVPDIISGKDLDYLCDMFNWNYGAYKSSYNAVETVTDEEVKNMIISSQELFKNNMNKILNILNRGGRNE